jgi:hypothetical protein
MRWNVSRARGSRDERVYLCIFEQLNISVVRQQPNTNVLTFMVDEVWWIEYPTLTS